MIKLPNIGKGQPYINERGGITFPRKSLTAATMDALKNIEDKMTNPREAVTKAEADPSEKAVELMMERWLADPYMPKLSHEHWLIENSERHMRALRARCEALEKEFRAEVDAHGKTCLQLATAINERDKTLPCGHPCSLMLKSAETGADLYCELCDNISGRCDAEQMETELRAKVASLESQLAAAREDAELFVWLADRCRAWESMDKPNASIRIWLPDDEKGNHVFFNVGMHDGVGSISLRTAIRAAIASSANAKEAQ